MWYRFMDMHSGGDRKTDYDYIFVEAKSLYEAEAIFEDKLDRDSNNVTCECCGPDYSIMKDATLEGATAFERGYMWDKETEKYVENDNGWYKPNFMSLEDFIKLPNVLVLGELNEIR